MSSDFTSHCSDYMQQKQPNLKIEDNTAPKEENESTVKRLIRFNQILLMCCSKEESLRDLPRAIRVLDKLAKVIEILLSLLCPTVVHRLHICVH